MLFKTFTKNIGLLFSISALSMSLLTMLTGILTITWISPSDMGIWNTFSIFITYIYILQFGVINGLGRELPFYLGKKMENVANSLTKTTLFLVKIISSIVFVIGVVVLIFFYFYYDSQIFFTVLSIVFLMLVQFYNNYLLSTYRSSNSFQKLTVIYLCQSVIILISLLLVYYYQYNGHLLRISLIAALQLLLLHYYRPFKINAVFNKKIFNLLIKTGLPLFILNYIYGIVNSFNRIIILQIGTALQMGLYSPAIAINSAMKLIPVTLAQYFYPKISNEAGKGSSPLNIWKYSKKISFLIFLSMIPIGVLGYLILPFIVSHFFSDYQEGLFTAQLSVVAGVFAAGSHIYITSLSSLKAFKTLTILNVLRAFVFYSVIYFCATNYSLLAGIGYGLIVSEIIFFITTYFLSRKYFLNLSNVR